MEQTDRIKTLWDRSIRPLVNREYFSENKMGTQREPAGISMKALLFIVLISFVLSSCATQIDYTSNAPGREARPPDCNIAVYFPGTPLNKSYEVIGSLVIGDAGLTVDCSQTTVLKQAREQGCKAGADAILINEVKEPDWISTCFRIRANMLIFTSTSGKILSATPMKNNYPKNVNKSTSMPTQTQPAKPSSAPLHKWHKPVE